MTQTWISASKILSTLFSLFLGGIWAEMLYLGALIFFLTPDISALYLGS